MGVDIDDQKIFACDTIQDAGILLNLPQVAMTTAQMLLHRVYITPGYTCDKFPVDITAMAALFLGAKVEEYPRKSREVIDVFARVIGNKLDRKISLHSSDNSTYQKVREELFSVEKRILKNLGFDLLSSYPHKILLSYYHAIIRHLDPHNNVWKVRDNKRIVQIAWNYCNDCSRTDIFMKYTKVTVACACIEMACEDFGKPFPKSSRGQPWYSLFVNESDVKNAMEKISDMYKRDRIEYRKITPYLFTTKL